MTFVYSPRPLVHHDNWMTGEEFTRLMQGTIFGGAALLTRLALTTRGPALGHLFRVTYRASRRRLAAGSLVGLGLLFVRVPRLSHRSDAG